MSQSWESLYIGGERYREEKHAGEGAAHVQRQREKDSFRDCIHIHSYLHAPTQTDETLTDQRDLKLPVFRREEDSEKKKQKLHKAKKMKP